MEALAQGLSGLDVLITSLGADCRAFHDRYRGRLGHLPAPELAALLDELGELQARLLWIESATALRLAVNLWGEVERDQRAAVEAALEAADDLLRFVELEWVGTDEEAALASLRRPELAPHRHFLASTRRLARHYLSEAEERALATCEPAAELAWAELYDRLREGLRVQVGERTIGVEEALSSLRSGDRSIRLAALEGLGRALEPLAGLFAHCYDTVVANRLAVGVLRGFRHGRGPRDLANELPPAVVDLMLDVVDGAADLPQSWFASKPALLGLSGMHLADERAPLPASRAIPYSETVDALVGCLADLSAPLGDLARKLLSGGLVDAEPRPGKQGHAFCRSLRYGGAPYLLLNYRDRLDDASTLAHEMGHALHFTISGRTQPPLSVNCPVVLREVPSTFTELLFAEAMVERQADPASRRSAAAKLLESRVEAVFLSAALTRFEERAHAARAEDRVLLAERLGELWQDASARYYGAAVDRPASQRFHWAVVPHLVHEPFYSYAYVFAGLACLGLLAAYRRDREEFAQRYVRFLARGGSAGPVEQLQELGFDPTLESEWQSAVGEMRRLLRGVTARPDGA